MGSGARSDQQRNRRRLIRAALAIVLEAGTEVSMETVARRAELGSSTLYRHFPTRHDLMTAVLDELIVEVRASVASADRISDPVEAFRHVFTQSCVMPAHEVRAFAGIAATSPRLDSYAQALIEEIVSPVTERLRSSGHMRTELTASDVALFIRMIDLADTAERRGIATKVLLSGILTEDAALAAADV